MKLLDLIDKASYLKIPLPWFFSDMDIENRSLRIAILRHQTADSVTQKVIQILRTVLWLHAFTIQAVRIAWLDGKAICRHTKISRGKLFVRLLGASFLDNVPPSDNLRLRLYRFPMLERKSRWILQREKATYFELIKPALEYTVNLNHKIKFFERCQQNALETPRPIIACNYADVDEQWFTEEQVLPRTDLFRKSITGFGGDGASLFRYDDSNDRWYGDDRKLTEDEVLNEVRSGGFVLQRRARNHPSIEDLGPEGLCTLRCVTLLNPRGGITVFAAIFRMPTGNMVVDHLVQGGIGAPVNLESGLMGPGFLKTRPWECAIERHPDTDGPILNRLLDWWPTAKSLCIRAHAVFPELPSVGWDLAYTTEGLTILEGNSGWNLELVQMGLDQPLFAGAALDWYQTWRRERKGSDR